MTDIKGRIQEANHAAATMLNISQQFLLGKPLVVFVAEAERHDFYTYLTQLHSWDGVWEREVRLQPCNNVSFHAALTIATVRDQEGKPFALRTCLRDITDRKRSESALREVAQGTPAEGGIGSTIFTISNSVHHPVAYIAASLIANLSRSFADRADDRLA